MITIYEMGTEDYASTGLGVLLPSECTVSEIAGGLFQLKMVHPMDDRHRWTMLSIGRTIKAPAPVRETPLVQINDPGSTVTRRIYKVTTPAGGRLRLRAKASTSAKIIKSYKPGTEVVRVKVQGDWAQVIIKKGGATGWMWNDYLTFVRDETETTPAVGPGTVVQPRQTGDQLFDIDTVEVDGVKRTVTVTALHISYRLRGNVINGTYEPKDVVASTAVQAAWDMLLNEHDFNLYATASKKITGEYTRLSIIEALLDPDQGILTQAEGRLIRDNFDVFVLDDAVRNLGVEIRHGKNLLGAVMTTDSSNVITRIIPVGRKANGDPLTLAAPGYVDSPHISEYPAIVAVMIEYDVTVGDGDGEYATQAAARTKLQELAQEEFANGADLKDIRLDIDFVALEQTTEYAQYADLQYIHLYDSVHVIDFEAGINATIRMTEYEFDSIKERYNKIVLGTLEAVETTVYGYDIAGDSVRGNKLVPGTVRRRNLGYGAVGWPGQVAPGVIGPIHLTPEMEQWFNDLAIPITEAIGNAEGRLANAEDRIEDTEGNVSALTVQAGTFASDIANAKGDISTIQQQADGIVLAVQGKLDSDDPAAGVETSGVSITSNQVAISTPVFAVNVEGTNGDMSLDDSGLSVGIIDSPSVASRYYGPATLYVNKNASDAAVAAGTHFRSLKAALNSLRYKHLGYQVTVSIANGTYYESDLRLWGVCGGHMLTIEFNDATLADTYFELANCTTSVILDKMRLTQRSIADHGVYVAGCKYVRFQQCRLTALTGATSTTAAIQGDRGSKIDVRESHMYGGWRAFRCNGLADGISINNKGDCRLAVDGSVIIASGTQPCDQSTFAYGSANGGIIHQTGVTVDFGSATPPEPTTATQTFAATTTRTAYGSAEWPGSWRSDTNQFWQGYTNGMQYQVGMMWFPGLSAVAGKTILEAKLTLRRVSGIGPGGKVKIIGYYGARASNAGSGSPTGRTSMGTLGTLSNGQQDDFTIPAAAISYLAADPTGRCLALHPGNSSVASGHNYSWDYCKFYGVGSGYVPYLEVTYEN
jgi:phage minor structural protein